MVPPLMVVALAFLSVVEGDAAPGLSDCLADAGVSSDSDNRLWSDRTGASTAPIVVAYPTTTPEVASVARCASASNVGTYAVSGRHSYQQNAEMISGRVMVDVSRMCTPEQISYDASKSTLEIPAGCSQGVLLGALPDNTLFPVGNCPYGF
jgi:FAD/FMN-containing dehydrogenase